MNHHITSLMKMQDALPLVGSSRCSILPGACTSVLWVPVNYAFLRRKGSRLGSSPQFSVRARIIYRISLLLNGWWIHAHVPAIDVVFFCTFEMQIHVSGIFLCFCSVASSACAFGTSISLPIAPLENTPAEDAMHDILGNCFLSLN
ncbi:hypothetical protein SETIT_2G095600v2 [Setaria italica]|uniref:Uncharacterized protein n=2 Tax=Setaria TaxID=4554 RepID=A0A368PXQ7_SETIT|nr:hypothetical protein SETIT_2G095600v2 [Setaria italica]